LGHKSLRNGHITQMGPFFNLQNEQAQKFSGVHQKPPHCCNQKPLCCPSSASITLFCISILKQVVVPLQEYCFGYRLLRPLQFFAAIGKFSLRGNFFLFLQCFFAICYLSITTYINSSLICVILLI